LDLTACLTNGDCCFGKCYEDAVEGEVLLVGCEDDYADTVVPRLLSAGADLARIHKVDGIPGPNGTVQPFSLDYYAVVKEELKQRPDVRLVVIDPAVAYVGKAKVDDHRDSELRALLGPLGELAAECRVTIVLVMHFNKAGVKKAVHKVSGSAGYVNAVRAAFVVAPDPEDETRKYFLPLKFNLGPKPRGLAYRLQGLPTDKQDRILAGFDHLQGEDRGRLAQQLFGVAWLGEVDMDVDQVVSDGGRGNESQKDIDQAAEWLREKLKAGPVKSLDCVTQGNEALKLAKQLKWWRDTILKAKVGGKPRKTGFGNEGDWWFTLPNHPWPPRPDDWTPFDEEDSPPGTSRDS
jgi:putative DNA primase/helicase